jgi:hypothetical protein
MLASANELVEPAPDASSRVTEPRGRAGAFKIVIADQPAEPVVSPGGRGCQMACVRGRSQRRNDDECCDRRDRATGLQEGGR